MIGKRVSITCIVVQVLFGCYLCSSIFIKPQEWNYFVFAQQWPPAACLEVPHGTKCSIPKGVIDWSIHGLWPTSDVGYPSFCNNSWPFNPQSLKTILQALEVKWPNIYANTPENSFWKHEWLKHGTCAVELSQFDSELKYFRRSLELHDGLNIFEFIRKAGLIPDATQPLLLKYVENAINLQLNKTVKLFCKNHKKFDYPILTSMYICLDKNLQVIDCDKITEKPCNASRVLYLPLNDTILENL